MTLRSDLARLPAEAWALFLATLINRTGTMVLPFLVLYLTRSLGFPAGTAGAMLAVYGVASIAAAPLAGRLSDRIGARPIMLTSLLSTGLILLLFPLAKTLVAVTLATVLFALANELFRPASLSVVTSLVQPDLRKQAFSVQRLAINLGMSVGPAVGGFLAQTSFLSLFVVDGVTSLLAFAVLAFAPWRAASGGTGRRPGHVDLNVTAGLHDRRLLFFLVALLPAAVVFFQHESSMALFVVQDLGLTATVYGLLHTVNTVLIVFLEVPLNSFMGRYPHRTSLVLGALLTGAGFGALVFARTAFAVALTVVIWTFGEMFLLPSLAAYVADLAPEERRGEYMGLYTMAFGGAFALGPWAGTLVLTRFGGNTLWIGAFCCGLVSALLFSRLKG